MRLRKTHSSKQTRAWSYINAYTMDTVVLCTLHNPPRNAEDKKKKKQAEYNSDGGLVG